MIKPWLDPVTVAKIHIVGEDYLPTLLEYIDISQIPEEFGGKRSNFGWNHPENSMEFDSDEMMEAAVGKIGSTNNSSSSDKAEDVQA